MRNTSLRFVCKYVNLRVVNADTKFTGMCHPGQIIEIPIAHGDGNYICDSDTLKSVESFLSDPDAWSAKYA